MIKEIETERDIELLVKSFYAKVYADTLLAPIFQDVAKIRLDDHIPTMVSFWASVLLGARSYHNNTYQIHHSLNQRCPLSEAHFACWVALFEETVDENFHGELAERAKQAANRISSSMQMGFVNPLRTVAA